MFSANDKISLRQLTIIFILDIFGTGIIVLPRKAVQFGSHNWWIIIIASCVLALALVGFLCYVGRITSSSNFYGFCNKILGKHIAFIVSLIYTFRLVTVASMELRIFAEIVKIFLLKKTPIFIIISAMLLGAAYLALKGIETAARVSELLFFLITIPLIVVFIIAGASSDMTSILPLIDNTLSAKNISIGSALALFNFRGLELILLSMPYASNRKKAVKSYSVAVVASGVFILFITCITIARFGVMGASSQLYPVLRMMDTIDLPGSFVERQDAIVMSFWIYSVFTITSMYIFFAKDILKNTFMFKKDNAYLLTIIATAFIMSLAPKDVGSSYELLLFSDVVIGSFTIIIIPVIIFFIAKARRVKA